MAISENLKTVAKHMRAIVGGTPKIHRYWDDNHHSSIDIFESRNRPNNNINTYSTIGLSGYSINKILDDFLLRVEFIGSCNEEYDQFANILATCAFNIINSKFTISRGEIYRNVIAMYYPGFTMKHIAFIHPAFQDTPINLTIDNQFITWLQALPISPLEEEFIINNGIEEFERLLEREEVDIFNLKRSSIL